MKRLISQEANSQVCMLLYHCVSLKHSRLLVPLTPSSSTSNYPIQQFLLKHFFNLFTSFHLSVSLQVTGGLLFYYRFLFFPYKLLLFSSSAGCASNEVHCLAQLTLQNFPVKEIVGKLILCNKLISHQIHFNTLILHTAAMQFF